MKKKRISFLLVFLLMSQVFSIMVVNAIESTETLYATGSVVLVDFDEVGASYVLQGFGGADDSQIVADPTNAANKVVKVVKGNGAETWAGTTFGEGSNNSIRAVPFSETDKKLSVRVYSPNAGVRVRLKLEDQNDGNRTVETESVTTKVNEWETLEFDFSNHAAGTSALNLNYTYDRSSIFFDFGNEGTGKTYYFDDLKFIGAAGPVAPTDPKGSVVLVDFNEAGASYVLQGFGGADDSQIVADPTNAANKVVKVVKGNGAETWAGTTFGEGSNNSIRAVPFSETDKKLSVRVYSPDVGVRVRLKLEDQNDGNRTVETESVTTKVNEWETLEFDFSNHALGTSALNLNYTYDRSSIFFDFGNIGTGKTYYFDDLKFIGAAGPVGPTVPGDSGQEWQLVWHDEFAGNTLDTTKWRIDQGNGYYSGNEWINGWGNNELQYYSENNVRIENGKLILEAREEVVSDEHGYYNYTSGKILTDESFSQVYGKFEAKMKLPAGQGYWPAFWMMPQDDVYGGWAASGEIDIMENMGSDTGKVGGAIHFGGGWPLNTWADENYYFPAEQSTTDFNVYAVEWEPNEIRWYVNGELYSTKNEWSSVNGAYPAPFDQEFHMILNLAIGGWYGGNPDASTVFPGKVEVEYVRVYEDIAANY